MKCVQSQSILSLSPNNVEAYKRARACCDPKSIQVTAKRAQNTMLDTEGKGESNPSCNMVVINQVPQATCAKTASSTRHVSRHDTRTHGTLLLAASHLRAELNVYIYIYRHIHVCSVLLFAPMTILCIHTLSTAKGKKQTQPPTPPRGHPGSCSSK